MDISQKILSDVVTFNKYAKYEPELLRRETWDELCDRNKIMHIRKYPHMKDEINRVYEEYVRTNLVVPSMRSMQFAGLPIELNHVRMYNCAFVNADHIATFWETMFLLLSGSGVGYSVQNRHISKLPVVKGVTNRKRNYLVGDSIIGWADAIKMIVRSYFEGKSDPVFDYRDVRKKGEKLITSGGKAPGPDPLRICIDRIRAVLANAVGRQLTSIEVHDIMCYIADAVLAGGIRRAAMIVIFDFDDMDMLYSKSGNWWELNPQRGRANNSCHLLRGEVTQEQFAKIWNIVQHSGSGEPGFIWTDDLDSGVNPCCVTGDTLVDVSIDGKESKMAVADVIPLLDTSTVMIRSYRNGEQVYQRIAGGKLTRKDAELVKVTDSVSGKSITCTPDHKIYTQNRGYVEAQYLESDDVLVIVGHSSGTVSVEEFGHTEDVYDFEVVGTHSFFANDILVHNCEIGLRSMQFCNLSSSNVGNVRTQKELNDIVTAAAFLATLQAGYTDFHYLRPDWQENCEEEALIGVSMTGIASGGVLGLDLEEAAECVKKENERVAKLIGINVAARTTCNKPDGSTSCRFGTSSGIHAWHNDYYLRRMRIGKNEALYHYLKGVIPELLEDCVFKPHLDSVLTLPQKAPKGAILRTESPIDLLNRAKLFNTKWVKPGKRSGVQNHNVSVTVSIKDDEWDMCRDWMWENRESYTGISVLNYDGGTYQQAPFEDCTEETYERYMALLKDIDLSKVIEEENNTNLSDQSACGGNNCEVS